MPRKKKTNGDNPIGIGLTTKQMKRKKPIGNTYLLDIEPITENQKRLFDSYSDNKHIVAYGLSVLAKEQLISSKYAKDAIKKYKIDTNKPMPTKL